MGDVITDLFAVALALALAQAPSSTQLYLRIWMVEVFHKMKEEKEEFTIEEAFERFNLVAIDQKLQFKPEFLATLEEN